MNRKGQNFIIELFAMIMIFSIIVIIISVNSLSGGKLIKFAQGSGFQAFSQDEVLLLFHESTELVTLSNNIDRITVDSKLFGCDECDTKYTFITFLSKARLESLIMLDPDEYESEAQIRFNLNPKNSPEPHVITSVDDVFTSLDIQTGLFFPSQTRSQIFSPGMSPGGRLNSYIYLLNPENNFDNVEIVIYESILEKDVRWRIAVIPLPETNGGNPSE